MRIGIDGRELLGHRTGVGRYLTEVCREWQDAPGASGHEFVVYSPAPDTALAEVGLRFDGGGRFRHRGVPGGNGTRWEQLRLPGVANRDHLDAFFAPGYSAPIRLSVPCVVTMHDVSFLAHPEWFSWREGMRRRWLARQAAARTDAIITGSRFSRDEIERTLDVRRERIHVVPYGIRPAGAPSGPPPTEPLVLYVGSIFNRRHLPTLIRAFARVRRDTPDAMLMVVGDNRTHPPVDLEAMAVAAGVAAHVTFRAYVTDDELQALYHRARVFAFLSEYEGFGLTPLEALAAGVPVVVADTPVAREVYDGAARLVPVGDVTATADAIRSLLSSHDLRTRLLEHATPRLASLTWSRTAGATLAVLERVVSGPR